MQPDPSPRDRATVGRGLGTEVWLLVPGARAELDARLQAFASTRFALVQSSPQAAEQEWAAAFARASSVAVVRAPELASPRPAESFAELAARAWPAFERACVQGAPRALLVQPYPVLLALLARALDLPLDRPAAVRVDPGRGVLLRDDALGPVLCRTNAAAPLESSGTALPMPEPPQ